MNFCFCTTSISLPRKRFYDLIMATRMSRAEYQYLLATTERNRIVVKDCGSPDDSTTGQDSESDTPAAFLHPPCRLSQMSSSAYTILKSIRYIKDGDQSACFTALSSIMDLDYTDEFNASAVIQEDGLELLVNMLEVNNLKCRLRTFEVMKRLTENQKIVTMVVLLGIAPILVNRLIDDALDEVALVCDVITNIARKRRAARAVRKKGGIPILVSFLDIKKELIIAPKDSLNGIEKLTLKRAKSAGHALWQLSKYSKVKTVLVRTGLIPIMSNIILVGKRSLFIPLVGVLCEGTSLSWFQSAIETEGLVGILLQNAKVKDPLVQRLCCRTLMQAAHGNESVRDMVRFHNGPKTLARLLASLDPGDKPLLAAAIGAIWKSAITAENAKLFQDLGVVEVIVRHLDASNLEVVNVSAGALAELGKLAPCREEMVRRGVVRTLAALLGRMIPKLIPNVAQALRECAKDEQGIAEIEAYDVVRLFWSLLTHESHAVRVQAARALEPCIRYEKNSGEVIRSITGSMLLLIHLLKHENVEFLQAVCAIVTLVCLDEENLAVLTEQGVASLLATIALRENFEVPREKKARPDREFDAPTITFSLPEDANISYASSTADPSEDTQTNPERRINEEVALHRTVAAAIANCCTRADNRQRFGSLGVIPRLVQFMESKDVLLQAQACRALHALSFSAANCVTIHSCHAVPHLLCAIGSSNEMTQLGAAGCMYNLRNLLLRTEKKKRGHRCLSTISRKSSSPSGFQGFF